MSDKIESVLNELEKKSKNIAVNIEEIIEEPDNDDDKKQKENLKKIKKQTKQIKQTAQKLNDKEISPSEAQKRVKKYQRTLQKLNKQSGNTQNIGVISKAIPRPKNNNPNDVRCFIRYNNQGNPYRICSAGGKSKEPPAQITPPIPVEEFLNKLGRTYGELTEGQRREYHRIDMANRRFDDRERNAPARDALDEVLKEQRRLGGFVSQQKRLDESKERKELKLELANIRQKYKDIVQESGMKKQFVKGQAKIDFELQAGLNNKTRKRFKDAGIKVNIDKTQSKQKQSKQELLQIQQQEKDLSKQIKTTKQTIKEGQDVVAKKLASNQFETTKKKVLVSFG